eukprot:GHVN01018310.1.p2 GENE.GHVN01018310.1~~GHVN01018310.1.p2  ORF type:complete len:174 (+),score=21.23 GHVN01018310.1:2-523(+)
MRCPSMVSLPLSGWKPLAQSMGLQCHRTLRCSSESLLAHSVHVLIGEHRVTPGQPRSYATFHGGVIGAFLVPPLLQRMESWFGSATLAASAAAVHFVVVVAVSSSLPQSSSMSLSGCGSLSPPLHSRSERTPDSHSNGSGGGAPAAAAAAATPPLNQQHHRYPGVWARRRALA